VIHLVLSAVDLAVARLERWLESMRGPDGYGGPVVHWWQDCLAFCGAGLDWRYEGIIAGYVALFERTGQPAWLEKARRAGDDLLRGQRADGTYRNSRFELNPGSRGTPHEAAADVGLLLLARALRDHRHGEWEPYLRAAERNLRDFYLLRLWSASEHRFRDDIRQPFFVPNKAATLIEALCLASDLTGDDEWLQRYVRPTADAIVEHQVVAPGNHLDGAIAQGSLGRQMIHKYFPFYNARCAPGLIQAYHHLGDPRYAEAALKAMTFVARHCDADGGFPQVLYAHGTTNRYPRWIAACGDILRGVDLLRPYGLDFPAESTLQRILNAQLPTGAFAIASGFSSQVSQKEPGGTPDARDLMPVVGWNDKIFRYLASKAASIPSDVDSPSALEAPCSWQGQDAIVVDDSRCLRIQARGRRRRDLYYWQKGAAWATFSPIGDA
jgi:hypothetical protein